MSADWTFTYRHNQLLAGFGDPNNWMTYQSLSCSIHGFNLCCGAVECGGFSINVKSSVPRKKQIELWTQLFKGSFFAQQSPLANFRVGQQVVFTFQKSRHRYIAGEARQALLDLGAKEVARFVNPNTGHTVSMLTLSTGRNHKDV